MELSLHNGTFLRDAAGCARDTCCRSAKDAAITTSNMALRVRAFDLDPKAIGHVEARRRVIQQGKNEIRERLACIFGNPFRHALAAPSWLLWNDGAVTKFAQTNYEDRCFDTLPILADALEDAGGDNIDILDHLRSPGPHVRGCWALDLILDRQ